MIIYPHSSVVKTRVEEKCFFMQPGADTGRRHCKALPVRRCQLLWRPTSSSRWELHRCVHFGIIHQAVHFVYFSLCYSKDFLTFVCFFNLSCQMLLLGEHKKNLRSRSSGVREITSSFGHVDIRLSHLLHRVFYQQFMVQESLVLPTPPEGSGCLLSRQK